MNNDGETKKGFSGLSGLASDVGDTIKAEQSKLKSGAGEEKVNKASGSGHASNQTRTVEPTKKVEVSTSDERSGHKKYFIIVAVIALLLWIVTQSNNRNTTSPKPLPKSSSQPVPDSRPTSVPTQLSYTKPSVGTNNILNVSEIRWCIREGIRIDAMRNVFSSNSGIDKFNSLVNDYNSRCGSYRYRRGAQASAERDVEPYQEQIISNAINEARQLESPYQSSNSAFPSAFSEPVKNSAPNKPDTDLTREAQQLLVDLGYEPGPIDGDYGRKTAEAVKNFQRSVGVTQDGWVSEFLLISLRSEKAKRTAKNNSTINQTNITRHNNNDASKIALDLKALSDFEREGIVSACQYRGSPAVVFSCHDIELNKLKRVGTKPDLSTLSSFDREGIVKACKYRGSPADVYSCQKAELNKLRQVGSGPDLSRLSAFDREGIIKNCKYRGSPADVYSCQKTELNKLRQVGSGPDLSGLTAFDRAGIINACKYRGSPADVYSCQKVELNKLKQVGSGPDLSGVSAFIREGIIKACKYRGSPADVYSCQKKELNKLSVIQ